MDQSEVSEHHLVSWGQMCGAVFRPDAAFCGMRLPRARQARSRRHVATSRSWGFGTTVRLFSIFRLLHLILKGGLDGCCNQGSWSGSDQSQRYLLSDKKYH